MGRDDSQGKGTNKQSLPQTPKNQKIRPKDIAAEFSKELAELDKNHKHKK